MAGAPGHVTQAAALQDSQQLRHFFLFFSVAIFLVSYVRRTLLIIEVHLLFLLLYLCSDQSCLKAITLTLCFQYFFYSCYNCTVLFCFLFINFFFLGGVFVLLLI